MARRLISDSVISNPTLTSMPIAARYLWMCLLVDTDDDGRVCVDVSHLRRYVFAGASSTLRGGVVEEWIRVWERAEMVSTYEFAGLRYAKINNFRKYQRLNRAAKSGRREQKGREENTTQQNEVCVGELPIDDGWTELERLAADRSDVDNPGGFVAHLRRKYDTPAEAIRSLRWDEPEPEDEWAAQFAAQQRRADERARQDEGRPLTTFHGQYRPSSGRSGPMPS